MFRHRELGLSQTYQIVTSLLVAVFYWVWYFVLDELVPGFELTGPEDYFTYFLAVLLGFQISFIGLRGQDMFAVTSGILESHRVVLPHVLMAAAITFMFLVVTKDDAISRAFLFTFLPATYVILVLFTRYAAFPILQLAQSRHRYPLVLVGKPSELEKVESLLSKARFFGMHIVGMVTEEETIPAGLKHLGNPDRMEHILSKHENCSLFILGSPRDRRVLADWLRAAEAHGCRVSMVNDLDVFLGRRLSYFRCDDVDLIELREEPLTNTVNRIVKRATDISVSLPVVLFLLPPLALLVWILQRLQAPGPLIFRQQRSGLDNHPFVILKFRTMFVGHCHSSDQATRKDPRIFPAGRWLRRLSLDEFPQFVNVLTGQMSIIGPRPHMVQHDRVFAESMSNYAVRGFVKPGISGLAQIRGFRGEALTPEDIAKRVECDIEYIERWSLMLDLRIVWQTLVQIVRPPGTAY
jgi:exopolysaccharide biosynthesis polyprenyl glycosylphosphotransferase